ncbi:ABC transporter permease [Nakamurella silvestris]|nr:ABC transporter permease [Nakamurella silvestris]
MRAGYVFSEVATGLRRNVTMTIAMILTTGISLGLLGLGLLIVKMTDDTKAIYGDKVEILIYLTADQSKEDPNCLQPLCSGLLTELQANPEISEVYFESQEQAYERYKKQFANQPAMLEIATADALQASFHIKLYDPQRFEVITQQYGDRQGVGSIQDQAAFLERLFVVLNGMRNATIILAVIQAAAAFLLISNMVQIAAYTRRTETEIMRLVGASRWRTQLPFLIEAVVAGLIGAAIAVGGLFAVKTFVLDRTLGALFRSGILPAVSTADLVTVAPILGGAGAVLAAVSAYVTLRLYVRI